MNIHIKQFERFKDTCVSRVTINNIQKQKYNYDPEKQYGRNNTLVHSVIKYSIIKVL
jgi:hypothetical protein